LLLPQKWKENLWTAYASQIILAVRISCRNFYSLLAMKQGKKPGDEQDMLQKRGQKLAKSHIPSGKGRNGDLSISIILLNR